MRISEVLTFENGQSLIKCVPEGDPPYYTDWVIILPPIEYTPKVGDSLLLEWNYHAWNTVRWKLNGAPWIVDPAIQSLNIITNSGTCVGRPLSEFAQSIS